MSLDKRVPMAGSMEKMAVSPSDKSEELCLEGDGWSVILPAKHVEVLGEETVMTHLGAVMKMIKDAADAIAQENAEED